MKIETHNALIDKAKAKKDGVYSASGYLYAVKNGSFVAYADCCGYLSTVHGMLHSQVGQCSIYLRKKRLREYLGKI
jgi:hypothetical protein